MPEREQLQEDQRLVTVGDLKERLKAVPTRWEVRFLILAAFVGGQIIPQVQTTPVHTALSVARSLL